MISIVSPRIHNLGDFAHCLPTISAIYKKYGEKISFTICDRLQRFRGIRELLLQQEMFSEVWFYHERKFDPNRSILIDDTGSKEGNPNSPISVRQHLNFIRQNYNVDLENDDDFELNIPKLDIDYHNDKLIIGDRWSPKDAPDVDERRYSNLIESSKIIPKENAMYLDYTQDLLYNCALIKYNPNPFVTTFTGIGILADLMKKDCYILWDEDMRNWQGWGVVHDYDLHYYKDRKSKLIYIKDFNYDN
ncbi:MAG: hypothetical protein EBU90_10115 [Proteobacteria bacterium]|nr:hypothetical protein [Pseudomonadota bacterium]